MSLLLLMLACSSPVLSVDQAPTTRGLVQHTVTLTGGAVRADLAAVYSRTCTSTGRMPGKGQSRCQEHYFSVAPVVTPTWNPSKPVSAWVTCPKVVGNDAGCHTLYNGQNGDVKGRVLSLIVTGGDSGWAKAVAQAKATHGIHSAERAPVVLLTAP